VDNLSPSARFVGLADLMRENTAARQALEIERLSLIEQRDRAEAERLSLIEQRDRVEAEAARLGSELARVEAERKALETEVHRLRVTFRQRLAGRGRALLGRLGL
jgi:ABC-type phosphate transport system auxiliary subunit